MAYASPTPSRASGTKMGGEGESSMMPSSSMSSMGMPSRRSSGGSMGKGMVTALVVVVILAAGLVALKYSGLKGPSGIALKAEWQAVFLSNGQVYFGKVTKMTPDFLVLSDIYYMQVITRQNTIGQPPDVQTQPEQQLTLIKLGNEIHGPRDEMFINREQVVLIEDLKDDGRVATAIQRYISGEQTPPAPAENTNTAQ